MLLCNEVSSQTRFLRDLLLTPPRTRLPELTAWETAEVETRGRLAQRARAQAEGADQRRRDEVWAFLLPLFCSFLDDLLLLDFWMTTVMSIITTAPPFMISRCSGCLKKCFLFPLSKLRCYDSLCHTCGN